MERVVVMVMPTLEQGERLLLNVALPYPRCGGVLRPFGYGHTRTVRGLV